ncbi:hypothetical protein BLNAU_1157 [Blattamonas nauphoetae]|uniref:Uncharacterized protein n=1 Tax=Blattamonas nauphoetae TaxID=2049346 RepID=A0ABQ9YJY3_9EUKA|nr:hypothetical protein BLNAU_1157 [Blattamonas nauphoetae]
MFPGPHLDHSEISDDDEVNATDVIVEFSKDHYRVNRATVTRIGSGNWVGCFTKPVTKGIHRLSIKPDKPNVMIGVLDAAEYPKYLTSPMYYSPKAAMMQKHNGCLVSNQHNIVMNTDHKILAQNSIPREGQEWSAEADLEKRTLHFFVDGVQQPHHFIDIPVPLVFAIDTDTKHVPIEITFWGELTQSHVTFQGTGHNLG